MFEVFISLLNSPLAPYNIILDVVLSYFIFRIIVAKLKKILNKNSFKGNWIFKIFFKNSASYFNNPSLYLKLLSSAPVVKKKKSKWTPFFHKSGYIGHFIDSTIWK